MTTEEVLLRLHIKVLVLTLSLTIAGSAFGSGYSLFEQGAKATAMGGAFAATADDPSAIFYNVAGIAQQRRLTILAGATFITFANQFTGDPNDEFTSGQSGQYHRHAFVPPNAYVTVPIGTNLTFGVGLMTPFGLRTDWDDPWIGRFVSRDANVKLVSIEPALAWQSADGRFALGGGAEYRRARIVLQRNNPLPGSGVNPFTGRIADAANIYLSSDWKTAWGWNLGVLWKASDRFRVGASYRASTDIDFTGDATFTQIPTGNAQIDALVKSQLPPNQGIATTLPFPATAIVGFALTTIPNTDLEFDVTHQSWGEFKNLDVAFSTTPQVNLHSAQDWEDTNSYRIGVNHRATPEWDVRFGLVYDENPEPVKAVSPLLPDSDREGVTLGAGYHAGPWIVDGTVFVLHFKTRSTNGQSQDFVNGTYKTNATLFSLNLGYRF